MRSGGSGSNLTGWQRDTTVSSIRPIASVRRTRCTNDAGSSSVFSILLATSSFMVSARSSTNTRRVASNGVRAAAATTGPSTSSTRMTCAPLGRTQVRSGWAPVITRRRTSSGSGSSCASSSAASARATTAFPVPGGPWKR